MQKTSRGNRTVRTIKVNRETLRRLSSSDLETVGGGYPTKPTACPSPGSEACCDTL